MDYAIWAHESITENYGASALTSVFIFYIAEVLAIACYASILVTWASLYVGTIKKVFQRKSKYFKVAKRIVLFSILLYLVTQFAFKICSFLNISSSLNDTLYMGVTVLYLLILMIWSTYHSVRINIEYKKRKEEKEVMRGKVLIFKWKNNLILVMNAFFLITILTLVSYTMLDARSSPWNYLIFMSVLRGEEWIILGLAIAVMQTYWCWRHPFKNWIENYYQKPKPKIINTLPSTTKLQPNPKEEREETM